jgi:hypothetical protein
MNDRVDAKLRARFSRQADTLPGPDLADLRRRARHAARARRRTWRLLDLRWAFALALALLIGSGFGFAVGTAKTPTGSAAGAPVGLGFLPERGWDVLQSGSIASVERPAVSIAANVELSSGDDADGLPLSTLETLPRNGVVIIASFTARGQEPSHDKGFPARSLPLSIQDSARFGIQLRPTRPLGQYELRAAVRNHNVQIEIYLGTPTPSRALLAGAQRQLARLVVASGPSQAAPKERAPVTLRRFAAGGTLSPSASRRIDRTFLCRTAFGSVDVVASPRGANDILGGRFTSSGYARVTSGSHGDPLSDLVVAARPGFRSPDIRFPAAVYARSGRCLASRTAVPLTLTGLPGPPNEFLSQSECIVDGRVLVRVRALLSTPSTWRRVDGAFVGARGRLLEAELAVRDQRTRRPLVVVRVGRTGKTQLWSSPRCA